MDVPVSTLRAELKSWIERARAGEEVVVTDRGIPVARLTAVQSADLMTDLVREGLITPAQVARPAHVGTASEAVGAAGTAPRPPSGLSGLVRRIRR